MGKEVIVGKREDSAFAPPDGNIELVEITRSAPTEELLSTQFSERATTIGASIMRAGAAYPIVVTAIFAVCGAVEDFYSSGFRPFVFANYVGPVFAGSIIGAGFGYLWSGIICIVVLPCIYFFVRSLRLHGSLVRLGAFSGGLVGFMAVLPGYGILLYEGRQRLQQSLVATLVGPALTTVLGQIGGARGSMRTMRRWTVATRPTPRTGKPQIEMYVPEVADGQDAKAGRMQFRIWHLLVVSIWVSLLLTAIRLMGVDFGFALSLMLGWSVYQAVTLWLGERLAAWLGPWWRRRKSRST